MFALCREMLAAYEKMEMKKKKEKKIGNQKLKRKQLNDYNFQRNE
jgi:hypothetical protein